MKSLKDIYIFVGPPGSGKGSLSYLCKKHLGWAHLSTGNLCRQHIAHMTEIGVQINQAIETGKLINDDLMINMVAGWIEEVAQTSQEIILDGFPRTIAQAHALDRVFAQDNFAHVSVVIVTMNIHDDHVINRLKTRYICQNNECQIAYSLVSEAQSTALLCKECGSALVQRVDDKSEVVYERLKTYHRYADDLLDYYRNSYYRMIDLNAEVALDNVFESFMHSTGKLA